MEKCNKTGWDSFFTISLKLNIPPGNCELTVHRLCVLCNFKSIYLAFKAPALIHDQKLNPFQK